MLSTMPCDMEQSAAQHLRQTLGHGLPPSAQAILGQQAGPAIDETRTELAASTRITTRGQRASEIPGSVL